MSQSKQSEPTCPSRRKFLRWAIAGGACLFGGTALTYTDDCFHPVVREVKVPLPTLPAAMSGMTVCQLSDIHHGPVVTEEYIQQAVEKTNSLHPDCIVLTGDYVWRGTQYIESCSRVLGGLEAPLGVYAVMGNHDYWSGDPGRIKRSFEVTGIRVLLNESAPIALRGEKIWLCGIDDIWSGQPDLQATIANIPASDCKILLCHEPDFADQAASTDIALQLSGHSHGGQMNLPLIGAPVLPYLGKKYPAGLQRVGKSPLLVYTNVGLGVATPIRINCPPEITKLVLIRA